MGDYYSVRVRALLNEHGVRLMHALYSANYQVSTGVHRGKWEFATEMLAQQGNFNCTALTGLQTMSLRGLGDEDWVLFGAPCYEPMNWEADISIDEMFERAFKERYLLKVYSFKQGRKKAMHASDTFATDVLPYVSEMFDTEFFDEIHPDEILHESKDWDEHRWGTYHDKLVVDRLRHGTLAKIFQVREVDREELRKVVDETNIDW